jgi:hypothetical protein
VSRASASATAQSTASPGVAHRQSGELRVAPSEGALVHGRDDHERSRAGEDDRDGKRVAARPAEDEGDGQRDRGHEDDGRGAMHLLGVLSVQGARAHLVFRHPTPEN